MKSTIVFAAGVVGVVAASPSPDPQMTFAAHAQLGNPKRQADPALLGYMSTDGASSFSDARTCDPPFTLSSTLSLAQCCDGSDCVFWSSCSAGTLFAQSTSLRCDQGYCNTAVLVPTPGAKSGESYLGCWATSLGEGAFTLVRDVGGAVATPSPTPTPTTASGTAETTSAIASTRTSAVSSARSSTSASAKSPASKSASAAAPSGTATESAASTTPSTGAAVPNAAKPLTGLFGLIAMLV